eukprot:10453747-Ditylum_brightwellii.AAC.1
MLSKWDIKRLMEVNYKWAKLSMANTSTYVAGDDSASGLGISSSLTPPPVMPLYLTSFPAFTSLKDHAYPYFEQHYVFSKDNIPS